MKPPLDFFTILVILITPVSVLTSVTSAEEPRHSPTMTYYGQINVQLYGVFHVTVVRAVGVFPWSTATVFYLQTGNGTLIRLVFYCGPVVSGITVPLAYCESSNQVQYRDGDAMRVKGTFIAPSQWVPGSSTPRLEFVGDLYVMHF